MGKYLIGFMSPGIAPIALIALGMWIYAEFKFDVKLRLMYGAFAILLFIATFEGIRLYGQSYERRDIRNSLYVIKEQMKSGNYQPITEAIIKFETNERNQGFAQAASELGKDFGTIQNQAMKKASNQKNAPDPKSFR